MPETQYPKNPNTDTAFVTDDQGKRTRAVKTVVLDGTIDYPKNSNSTDCYVTVDGKKQRALMIADISSEGTVEYPTNSNSTKGYITVNGKKQRVVLTASLVGGGSAPVIEELNVTPSTSAQVITAQSGTDGYNPVNVSAVDSSIDANIVAGNIKKDVQILGVTGSYEGTAPDYYIKRTASAGTLYSSDEPMDLHNITEISAYRLAYALYGATLSNQPAFTNTSSVTTINNDYSFYYCCSTSSCITSGLSSVTSISGSHACNQMFKGSSCTTTGFTSLQSIGSNSSSNAYSCCDSMFMNCSQLTSTDLGNLQTINSLQINDNLVETCKQMFKQCTALTSTGLSSLKVIAGQRACEQMFYGCTGLTGIGLDNLESISGTIAAYQMFQNCTGLTTAIFTKLKEINKDACYYTFDNCTNLVTASFPKLKDLTNANTGLEKMFSKCTSLQNVYFYMLTPASFGGFTNQFKDMLSGCSNVTVHFPKQIQSTIGSWSDVTNGFGGTNTTVLFDLGVNVTISVPAGYTVYVNGTDVTNLSTLDIYEGDNEIVSVSSDGKVGKYNFVATSSTTAFVFDPTQITYNEFTITANESGATYTASVATDWISGIVATVDANNKVYCSAGCELTIYGTLSGYIADPVTQATTTSGTIAITFVAGSSVVYNPSDLLSAITGDTSYASEDTINNLFLYNPTTTASWNGSVQLQLTVPAGTTKIKIVTGAYVSSEVNYDFGFISLGTQRATPTYTQIKNGTGLPDGAYLFKQSGTSNVMTPVSYETTNSTLDMLNIGWGQDSSVAGTNTLYIQPITVFYYQ